MKLQRCVLFIGNKIMGDGGREINIARKDERKGERKGLVNRKEYGAKETGGEWIKRNGKLGPKNKN
jgi:hypothetical protein